MAQDRRGGQQDFGGFLSRAEERQHQNTQKWSLHGSVLSFLPSTTQPLQNYFLKSELLKISMIFYIPPPKKKVCIFVTLSVVNSPTSLVKRVDSICPAWLLKYNLQDSGGYVPDNL